MIVQQRSGKPLGGPPVQVKPNRPVLQKNRATQEVFLPRSNRRILFVTTVAKMNSRRAVTNRFFAGLSDLGFEQAVVSFCEETTVVETIMKRVLHPSLLG